MLTRLWRKGISCTPLLLVQNVAAAMENSMESPQKLKTELSRDSVTSLLGTHPPKSETRDSNICLYTYVNSCIIHNSQKMEVTQASTDRWMDNQNVTFTYDGILCSIKNKEFWHIL